MSKLAVNHSGTPPNERTYVKALQIPPQVHCLGIQLSGTMDFQGQKLAEQLCLYIICAAGAVAFALGWAEGSFALMMKASPLQRSP